MQEIFIKTEDNIQIALNHYKSNRDEVVIIAPGWFMTKDSKAFSGLAGLLRDFIDVITFDFRGHGRSSGFYTFSAKEPADIEAIVNYAKNIYKKVYLMGFSLGAALVLIHGALKNNADKIIAVSAPTDFMKIENHIWSPKAFIPTFKKFELKRWLSVRPALPFIKKIKPIDVVNKIQAPTLFIAGDNDPTVYPWHTKALFDKASCEKSFELFENANHAEDLFIDYQSKFLNIVKSFLFN